VEHYRPDWLPDWTGATAVVVASGPSARNIPLGKGRGLCRFIAINNSWQLAPWSDVLYGADEAWWSAHGGVHGFQGLKVSGDPRSYRYHEDVKQVFIRQTRNDMLFETRGCIGNGGGSGFQAVNLAAQLGATKIILVGFDMHAENGVHWHGLHKDGLQNPSMDNMQRWRDLMDAAAPSLKERGIEVVNCSQWSALRAYRKGKFASEI